MPLVWFWYGAGIVFFLNIVLVRFGYGLGMVLVSGWYGFGMVWYGFGTVWYGVGMVSVWFWYGVGMVLVLF